MFIKLLGRPALYLMTLDVVGSIAANNLGYSKVAMGIVLYLKPTPEAQSSTGREYFNGSLSRRTWRSAEFPPTQN